LSKNYLGEIIILKRTKTKDKKEEFSIEEAIALMEAEKANPMLKYAKIRKTNRIISLIAILSIIAVIILGIFGSYTAYVAYHEGKGGYIYQLNLLFKKPAYNWAGLYGAAFGVGLTQPWEFDLKPSSMTEANMFFECVEKNKRNLMFASTVPESQVDFNSLIPASPALIDQYIGINSTHYDSAYNTFTKTMSIELGSRTINNIPYVATSVGTGTEEETYDTGILKDRHNNLVYVAHLNRILTRGFNDRYYNYQFLLPIGNNQTTKYYVFINPFNVCLAGENESDIRGGVYGTVTDISGNTVDDVIIVVSSSSTVTNQNGFYNLTATTGEQKIIAIKQGYKVYAGNVTVIEDQMVEHNIILELDVPPNIYTDIGPDYYSDQGPDYGPDYGPGEVPYVIERPFDFEGKEFWIPYRSIEKKIREGEFAQDIVYIQSFKLTGVEVDFTLTGDIVNLTVIDKKNLYLNPREESQTMLTFFGNLSPGVYNGSLNITGGIEAEIPISIEILDKDKIPIQALLIGISATDKKLYPGSKFTFRTDFTNLLTDREYPVQAIYTIQNIEGTKTVWTHTTNLYVKTSVSVIKTAPLPTDLPVGDYALRVTANYLGLTTSSNYLFTVNLPLYEYMVFGKVKLWHLLLIILGLAGIIAGIIYIKKDIESKKKYHLKVDYTQIPKVGPRNIFVGKIAESDNKAYINIENLKTHTIVAGSTGGGKSFSAQVIIEELLMKDVAVIVFDPTAQWTGMLRKLTNKGLLSLYPNFGMKENQAMSFKGNIREIKNARELIDIKKYMKPGEIQVFAIHRLDPKDIDIFVANTVREVFHSNFDESEPLRLCLVYDEVHRLLPKFGGSGEGFLQIERACREFRKWGIGVMLISQVLADFVGQIKANINTEIQMRTRDEGDLDRIKVKYGADILQSLVKASVGTGMLQNSAYNRGKPYFVTFRPILHSVARLSDDEIESYNTYNEQIDQIQYELDQLEELKQDVFDLKLELKLALDKVKSGNFNMVKIYLDGLLPRLKKVWDKLGKAPKKLEIRMVSEAELKEELEKAKQDRKDFVAQNKQEETKKEEKEDMTTNFKKDVPPDKILKLVNGMLVVNPKGLYSEVEAMKDSDFESHVNDSKNDLADWIISAVNDIELGNLLYETKDRSEILKLLDMREKGQKLPALKNPPKINNEETKAQGPNPKLATDLNENVSLNTENSKKETSTSNPEEQKQSLEQSSLKSAQINKDNSLIKPDENIKAHYQDIEKFFDADVKKSIDPQKKKEILERLAPKDKSFWLSNGVELKSISELANYLSEMSDEEFNNHVNESKNDFSAWVLGVFGEKEIADKISKAKTKKELFEVINNA